MTFQSPSANVNDGCDELSFTVQGEVIRYLAARVNGASTHVVINKDDARALGNFLIDWADGNR